MAVKGFDLLNWKKQWDANTAELGRTAAEALQAAQLPLSPRQAAVEHRLMLLLDVVAALAETPPPVFNRPPRPLLRRVHEAALHVMRGAWTAPPENNGEGEHDSDPNDAA